MLKPKRVVVTEREGAYVGIAFREGILANTIPLQSPSAVIENLRTSGVYCNEYVLEGDPVADLIFRLWDGDSSRRASADLTFDMTGLTPKTVSVLETVEKIPRGNAMSYGEVASRSGLDRAARFVGNVMASNRFPLLIPCHRVVRSDGSVGLYGQGPDEKERILRAEGCLSSTTVRLTSGD